MNILQPTFFWHDYETWGLNPALDRPSQFAGIRTDMDFNVIAEPEMFYCRLSDDYLPNPEPAIITGITPEITQSEGINEYEFAARIQQQFTQTNTCVVGYNSIRFDEEFSRYLFYRNFYDPYEYSWKNGNSRWDIIDLVRATYALRPEGIEWPSNEKGLPTFRLELLTKANGISHENAHDATSDVYATIAMAKLIKEKSPKLFNYYFSLRHKNKVKALIDVDTMTPLVHVSGMIGSARANLTLIAPVVWHPINSNAVVVIDLSQDVSPLLALTAEEIRTRLYTKKSELSGQLPIPLKLIHINKSPFISIIKTLSPENADRLGINIQLCLDNLQILKECEFLSDLVKDVFGQEREFESNDNVDEMLYQGFFSLGDKVALQKIVKTPAKKLNSLVLDIGDKRFQTLFFRYRARNFFDTLTHQEKEQWKLYLHATLIPTSVEYFNKLNVLAEEYEGDVKNLDIIFKLRKYAETILSRLN